jgi:hypothetical protein
MRNLAGDMLYERMQRAFAENPRGELYRTLPQDKLVRMLEQNLAEVKVAIMHGNNDLEDKLADCGNYAAFLLRNHVDPLTAGISDPESVAHLHTQLRGMVLTPEQGADLVRLVRMRVLQNPGSTQRPAAQEHVYHFEPAVPVSQEHMENLNQRLAGIFGTEDPLKLGKGAGGQVTNPDDEGNLLAHER